MVAVAASPTPGPARGSLFVTRSHDHPPYKDMIVSAIEALKDRKGSSRRAISKYISDSYSDLPPTHASLLTNNLRRLQSNGLISMLKHSYKLADKPAAGNGFADFGSKKRGRPPKNAHLAPKLGANAPPETRRKTGQHARSKTPDVVESVAVYILPQAKQLKSGFLQSLPGAVAIVLPEGLLSKKTAKNPVLILPNGVQSLVNASTSKNKLGRPRKAEVNNKPDEPRNVQRRQPGRPRRKAVIPKQVLLHNGDTNHVNLVAKKVGRPRKIKDDVFPVNEQLKSVNEVKLAPAETEHGIFDKARKPAVPYSPPGMQKTAILESKKRAVGRVKKDTIVEGSKFPRTYAS